MATAAALGSPSPAAIKRLQQEMKLLQKSPPEGIVARPDEANILLWHYVLTGPKGTPYEGGTYLGKLRFPPDYPFAPPSILMTTPNGRFKTDTRLCLSISDYHPKEWNPVWNVSTILTGLLSFMVSEDITAGSMETTVDHKKNFAKQSHAWNLKFPTFKAAFPELIEEESRLAALAIAPPPSPVAPRVCKAGDDTNMNNGELAMRQDGLFARVLSYSRRGIIAMLQLSLAVVAIAFVVLLTM